MPPTQQKVEEILQPFDTMFSFVEAQTGVSERKRFKKSLTTALAERDREILEAIEKKVYEGHPEGCRHTDREIVNLSDIKALLTNVYP